MPDNPFDILAIGNIAIEHICRVDRIPANQKTGLILRRGTYFGGRAGNIALALARLGLRVAIASIVGEDFAESGYASLLTRNHVNIDRIRVISHKKCASTIVSYTRKGDMIYFFDPIVSGHRSTLNLTKNDVANCSVLYMTSFNGERPIRQLIELTRQTKITIVVALGEEVYRKSRDFLETLVGAADYLFANEVELETLLMRTEVTGVMDLFGKYDRLNCLAVTLGQRGSVLYTKEGNYTIQPVLPHRTVNALGAGDAYVAGFIYGLQKKLEIQKCGKMASVVASFALEEEGAQPSSINVPNVRMRYDNTFPKFKVGID